MSPLKGMALARHIFENREEYPRKLKKEGKSVIGYICCFSPPEIMHAAGALPYRITGQPGESTSEVDNYLEPFGCSYIRNIFSRYIRGKLDFLDGLVISHSCDMVQRLYGIWTYYYPFPYSRLVNVPHQLHPWSQDFFYRELVLFKESLENHFKIEISTEALTVSIDLYNHIRQLIRELYQLRGGSNPKLLSSELMEVLVAGEVLSPEDFLLLLQDAVDEIASRNVPVVNPNSVRILVWGSILDHPHFYRLIEEAGGQIVTDDTCLGERFWNKDVPVTEDPVEGLKEQYLLNFQCPRIDRGPGTQRFAYLKEMAEQYRVQGAIGYVMSFCDPHKLDYPDLHDYLDKEGIPMLLIDDNYSLQSSGSISTRLQAFMEMLS
ncbi:MAG: 2-hydroxyacyl-CoA dehydratase family protein [Bacillota bacterium]|nr:2-hydroxyacyl-CoA dehydratase family protein [Bacillota bacterium]